MLLAGSIKPKWCKEVPGVVNDDGSCRVQTLSREQNQNYYELINAFYDFTGCPMILNTSFNGHNEPIVETYDDAISCFLNTKLDYLYLDGLLIDRQNNTSSSQTTKKLKLLKSKIDREYVDLLERFCDNKRYVELALKLIEDEKRITRISIDKPPHQ